MVNVINKINGKKRKKPSPDAVVSKLHNMDLKSLFGGLRNIQTKKKVQEEEKKDEMQIIYHLWHNISDINAD